MGWGLATLTPQEVRRVEAIARSKLENDAPSRCTVQPAKPVLNFNLLATVMEKMRADGIDGGFSFRHLEAAVFGSPLNWLRQLIGSCVASGGRIVDSGRMIAESFLLGDPEEIFGSGTVGTNNVSPFAPFSYRAGRKLAGFNGRDDGSLCDPHIRGKMTIGLLPCSAVGLGQYTDAFPEPQREETYRQWGADDTLLNRFTEQAKRFVLLESSAPDSAEKIKEALTTFKPMQICSGWAFKPDKPHPTWKLADGSPVWIYTRDRNDEWQHNMSLYGWHQLASREEFCEVRNTWANYHKNGDWFVIRAEEADAWARDRDQRYGSQIRTIGNISTSPTPPPFPGE